MRRLTPPLLLLTCLLFTRGASADPPGARPADTPGPQTAAMREHFKRGVALFDARDPAGALVEFRAAYAIKPLPDIKRNVALCLRALGRAPEAIEALEEMLREGGDRLKPEVRAAAERAITELGAQVATVRVRVVPGDGRAGVDVAVAIDEEPLPADRVGATLRVRAGEHVFRARAPGYAEALRTVIVDAGARDVEVLLELVPVVMVSRGTLRVRVTPADAKVAVDGSVLGAGGWQGVLRAGRHRVVVTAPGYATSSVDAEVPADGVTEVPVTLRALAPIPPRWEAPARPSPPEPAWYGAAGLTFSGVSTRLAAPLDRPSDGTRRTFGGAAVLLKLGRPLSRSFDVEGIGELGADGVGSYASPDVPGVQVKLAATRWALAPSLRFHAGDTWRFVAAVAVGLQGQWLSGTVPVLDSATQAVSIRDVSGDGVGIFGALEGGLQWRLGRWFLTGTLFGDLHDQSRVRDGAGRRLFSDTSSSRGGVRLLVERAF